LGDTQVPNDLTETVASTSCLFGTEYEVVKVCVYVKVDTTLSRDSKDTTSKAAGFTVYSRMLEDVLLKKATTSWNVAATKSPTGKRK